MTSQAGGLVISVMLAVEDTPTAVAWYKRALGARELWHLGSVAGMELEGAPFLPFRTGEERLGESDQAGDHVGTGGSVLR